MDVAQAHAGWADTLTRTLGVSLARYASLALMSSPGRGAEVVHLEQRVIQARRQIITGADLLPDDLGQALEASNRDNLLSH